MIDQRHGWNTSFKPLIWGLVLSVVFTVLAYYLAVSGMITGWSLTYTVLGICVIQVFAQLIFFLHLFLEDKPMWNMLIFWFLVLVVIVVIGGTLWIMKNLNYNTMIQN